MQQRWVKLLLPVASLALIAYLAANALTSGRGGGAAGEPAVPRAGERLPDFALPTADGETVTRQDLLGKPTFLNFWASWCGPCRMEMPAIDALAREERGKVAVLAVNNGEPVAVARAFMRDNGFDLPVALDQDGALAGRWGFRYLPTSVFVDRRGTVCSIFDGALDEATMKREIARAKKGC